MGININPSIFSSAYEKLQPFLREGTKASEKTSIVDIHPTKIEGFIRVYKTICLEIIDEYFDIVIETAKTMLICGKARYLNFDAIFIDLSTDGRAVTKLNLLASQLEKLKDKKMLGEIFSLKGETADHWVVAEPVAMHNEVVNVIQGEVEFQFTEKRKAEAAQKEKLAQEKARFEEKQRLANQAYEELLAESQTQRTTPPTTNAQKKKSKKKKNKARPSKLHNQQTDPASQLESSRSASEQSNWSLGNQMPQSISPHAARVVALNSAHFHAEFELHYRVMRWRTNNFAKIREFTDFDKQNECFVKKYAHYTDEELSYWKARHNLSGIERFLSDQEIYQAYTKPYEHQDGTGAVHKGRSLACTMQTADGRFNGFVNVAIDENNKIYHAMFEEHNATNLDPTPKEHGVDYAPQETDWIPAASFQFDLKERDQIQLLVDSTVFFTFYPNEPQLFSRQ